MTLQDILNQLKSIERQHEALKKPLPTDEEIEEWAFAKCREIEDSRWYFPLIEGAKWMRSKMLPEHFRKGIKLLRDLADLQNGAPLETYRKDWEETMREVYDFLNLWEGNAPLTD